jgi:hypothetical protein
MQHDGAMKLSQAIDAHIATTLRIDQPDAQRDRTACDFHAYRIYVCVAQWQGGPIATAAGLYESNAQWYR